MAEDKENKKTRKEKKEESQEQNRLLLKIKEEIKKSNDDQKGRDKKKADLQFKLDASYKAFPDASLIGNKQLQTEVKKQRDSLKADLQKISEEEQEANVHNKSLDKQLELTRNEIQKQAGLFEKSLVNVFGMDFKEKLFDSFNAIKGWGKGKAKAAGGFVVDKAKGFADFLLNTFKVIGGLVGIVGFLQGLEKANDWFGENANFSEQLAAGFAGMLGLILGLSDDTQKNIACWIDEYIFQPIKGIFTGIKDMMDGDWIGGFWDVVKGVFVAGLFMFPGLMIKGFLMLGKFLLPMLWTALTTVVPFILSIAATIASTMLTAMSGFLAALAPVVIAAAPFIAIGLAIAAVVGAIAFVLHSFKKSIDEMLATWEDTGSIWETIKAGFSDLMGTLLGLPFDLLKSAISWVAEKLLGEGNSISKFLDSFSFSDLITDMVAGAFDFVKIKFMEMVNSITGWWNSFITGDTWAAKALREMGVGGDAMEAKEAKENLGKKRDKLAKAEEELALSRSQGVSDEDNALLIKSIEAMKKNIAKDEKTIEEKGYKPTHDIEKEKQYIEEVKAMKEQRRLEQLEKDRQAEEAKDAKKASAAVVNTQVNDNSKKETNLYGNNTFANPGSSIVYDIPY